MRLHLLAQRRDRPVREDRGPLDVAGLVQRGHLESDPQMRHRPLLLRHLANHGDVSSHLREEI
eukprot:6489952-Prymnesium_polylepis.1